jgi:hypothetical protein
MSRNLNSFILEGKVVNVEGDKISLCYDIDSEKKGTFTVEVPKCLKDKAKRLSEIRVVGHLGESALIAEHIDVKLPFKRGIYI